MRTKKIVFFHSSGPKNKKIKEKINKESSSKHCFSWIDGYLDYILNSKCKSFILIWSFPVSTLVYTQSATMTWNWKAVIQIRHKSGVYNNNRIENKNMCWTQEYTVRYKKQFWSQLSVMYKLCSRWDDVQGKGREGDTDAFGSHPSLCWKTHKQNYTAGRIIPVCCVYWNEQMRLCQSVLPFPLIWLCALSTSVLFSTAQVSDARLHSCPCV